LVLIEVVTALVSGFQFIHLLTNLCQSFLPLLMLHIGFAAVPGAAQYSFRRMDCRHLLTQGCERGLAKGVIYNRVLRTSHDSCQIGRKTHCRRDSKLTGQRSYEMLFAWPKQKEI